MTEHLTMKEIGPELATAVLDYLSEMRSVHSPMDGCGIYRRCHSVPEIQDFCERIAAGERFPNLVPSTQYLSLLDDGTVAGMLDLRHELNEHLANFGGHIGYSVRPSLRGKGYGKAQLALGLEKASNLGLPKVLITCDRLNPASRAIILANGGEYENTLMDLDEEALVERYWIALRKE